MSLGGGGAAARWAAVGLLAAGHGIGDFNAGAVLASLDARVGGDLVVSFLLYNVLAFAAQPIAGWVADRVGSPLGWFLGGGVLSAVSLAIAGTSPWTAVTLAGIASAMYHSGGGAAAWKLGGETALAAGIFSAPGVLGLALGLGMGRGLSVGATSAVIAVLLAMLGAAAWVARGLTTARGRAVPRETWRTLAGGVAGWLLVLAIAARSFAWTLGQEAIFPADAAIAIAVSAAVGKSVAGFLADRWSCEAVTLGALLGAVFLLGLSQRWVVLLFPAAAALQGGTGPMMALALRAWPGRPAFASGLAQGLAVAVGGAPLLLFQERPQAPWICAVLLLGVAFALVRRGGSMATKGTKTEGVMVL